MSYSISTLKTELAAMSHGTTTNQMVNLDGLIDRAARQLLMDCDFQETKRITELSQVYAGVYDYALPADLKGNKVIDIFPQVNRSFLDRYLQLYNQEFDINKLNILQNDFTIQFNNALKTIRINSPLLNDPVIVNGATSLTDNGTWAADGVDAVNLAVDNTNYVYGGGCLVFDLSGAGTTATLTNSTMTALDLSDQTGQGTFFVYVYMPDASAITAVQLRWGSSSGNYHQNSVSVTQANTAFQNGWNLLAFSWASATDTGTPDDEEVDYLRLQLTYDGDPMVGVRVNDFNSVIGTVLGIEYYSKYLFRSASGTFQETVLADTDLVNLDTESYNLLTYQGMIQVAQQLQGVDALQFDATYFTSLYRENLTRYQAQYKSEVQKPRSTYYTLPQPGYARQLSRRFR